MTLRESCAAVAGLSLLVLSGVTSGGSASAPGQPDAPALVASVPHPLRADEDAVTASALAVVTTPITPGLAGHVEPSCSGTGSDGNRVQVMYVREAGRADRYTNVLPVILNNLRDVDDIYAVSAKQTGGGKRVRWVHENCVPTVLNVTVPSGTFSNGSLIGVLADQGYTDPARKYLAYTDTTDGDFAPCGSAQMLHDDSPTGNLNDGSQAQVGWVNANCWAGNNRQAAAHELTHALGAVQDSAAHSTRAGHCTDESDLMCYDDGTTDQPLTQVCAKTQEILLDCGKNDYFHTNPAPRSYLAEHWNIANSSFLDDVAPLPGEAWPEKVQPTLLSLRVTKSFPKVFTARLKNARTGQPLSGKWVSLRTKWDTASWWNTFASRRTNTNGVVRFRFRGSDVSAWFRTESAGDVVTRPARSKDRYRVSARY